jgi:biotin synthase
MDRTLADLGVKAESGQGIPLEAAADLARPDGCDLYDLLYWANRVRLRHKGRRVRFCSIMSAKQGLCPEDCRFCAQSSHWASAAAVFPLRSAEEMLACASERNPAHCHSFGLVTSGLGPKEGPEWERVLLTIRLIAAAGRMMPCASLGVLSAQAARELVQAGLRRYNHNLETSERFFHSICTTHTFEHRVRTIRNAKAAGLQVCSGGIFGLGETTEDRIAMAGALRDLGVDSIPINFLNPIPGTPLEHATPPPPLECLRTIAVYRLLFPTQDIKVAGGREVNLRDLQSWMFYAGANGAILGNYLTTAGRNAEEDLRMVRDLGLECEPGCGAE